MPPPSSNRAPFAPGETFDSFLRRVRSIAPLTAPRERRLAARVARGDLTAKRELAEANIRLVVSVALRYRNRGLELEDLVQEGALGLMRAIDKFDPQRGCRLSTYAPWWVRQSIGQAIRERGRPVRLPGSAAEKLRQVECCRVRLVQRLGREPEPAEIASASGISVQTLESLRAATQPAVPLEDGDCAGLSWRGETIADPFA